MSENEAQKEDLAETEFGTIPDYVSARNRERILELSQPNEKEISPVECNEYLIRHWLETVEDGNPLYNDPSTLAAAALRISLRNPA